MGGEVSLSGVTMDQDSIESSFVFDTKRKCKLEFNALPELVYLNRWLCIPDAKNILCYDMNSFKASAGQEENDMESGFTYDALTLPLTANIKAELESLSGVPSLEPTERDGYPTKCIKCGGDTVQGAMFTKNRIYSGSYESIGLGRAACFDCMIRYSKTDKRWECMKPAAQSGVRCSAKVPSPLYCCSEPHVPDSQYKFRSMGAAERKLAKASNEQLTINLNVIF